MADLAAQLVAMKAQFERADTARIAAEAERDAALEAQRPSPGAAQSPSDILGLLSQLLSAETRDSHVLAPEAQSMLSDTLAVVGDISKITQRLSAVDARTNEQSRTSKEDAARVCKAVMAAARQKCEEIIASLETSRKALLLKTNPTLQSADALLVTMTDVQGITSKALQSGEYRLFRERRAACAEALANAVGSMPHLECTTAQLEQGIRLGYEDSWAASQAGVLRSVRELGGVEANGLSSPLMGLFTADLPVDLRRIFRFCAPQDAEDREGRLQWASALAVFDATLHDRTVLAEPLPGAAAGTAAERLPLTEVIPREWCARAIEAEELAHAFRGVTESMVVEGGTGPWKRLAAGRDRNGAVNLALRMEAKMSSEFVKHGMGKPHHKGRRPAENAVDGDNSDTNDHIAHSNSSLHTSANDQSWWEVDLGCERVISEIRVYTRSHCMSRLWPSWVLISDGPMPHGTRSLAKAQAQSTKAVRMTTHQIRADVKMQARGRFVRVQLEGKDYLQLAQVEVYTTAWREAADGLLAPCLHLDANEVEVPVGTAIDAWEDLCGRDNTAVTRVASVSPMLVDMPHSPSLVGLHFFPGSVMDGGTERFATICIVAAIEDIGRDGCDMLFAQHKDVDFSIRFDAHGPRGINHASIGDRNDMSNPCLGGDRWINGSKTQTHWGGFGTAGSGPGIITVTKYAGRAASLRYQLSSLFMNRGFRGIIGEVVAFNRALADDEVDTLHARLAEKWAITLL